MAGPPLQPHGGVENQERGGEAESQRWCAEEPCRRRPFFGNVGGKPLYCSQHAKTKDGMVDVSSRRCEAVGCAKWPLYGNEGEKAKFCSLHKSATMIDVRSRRCAAKDCKRQPSYGFEGKRACFCAAHKEPGMVDVVSRRCEEPNCRRRPLYGYEGQKSQFCSAHKREGQVDVCNRRCQQPNCSKRPCFGLPGQRPTFCGTHRSPEMVDVISHKCSYPSCSHPTGHERNRVRSKFCDNHKSVGLAGASLLQLASAAAQGSAFTSIAGTGQNTVNAPPPPPQSEETPEGNSNPRFGGSQQEGDRERRRLSRPTYPAVAEAPRRRATYNEPLASGMEPLVPEVRQEQTRRRATLPAVPLLPSMQSLLEDMPMARLKRQREEGEGGLYDIDVDTPSSLLRSPPPPAQEPALLAPAVGISGGSGTERGDAATVGAGDEHEGGSSTPGSSARGVASHGSATAAAADASAHSRPPTKAARLFSTSGTGGSQQDGGGWQSRQKLWNPRPSQATTGYIVSSPAPDWRRVKLASMGRAASFDEARAAANKHGLNVDGGGADSSKPRRASAFVSHGSALPPKMTEINRRTSALDPGMRAAAAARPVPHYSDLLSAKATSRSLAAFNSYASHSPLVTLGNPEARIEEEGGGSAFPGGLSSATTTAARAAGGAGGEAQARRPPTASRAAPMFHIMPATAAFDTGLGSLPPDGTTAPASSSSSSSRDQAGGARRWSVLDPGPSGSGDKEVGGNTAFVPAWGAPAEERGGDGDGNGDGNGDGGVGGDAASDASEAGGSRRAATTGGSGGGNKAGGNQQQPSSRAPRRGSMMAPPAPTGRLAAQPLHWPVADAANASDHPQSCPTANAFAPAWGAPSEEEPAKDPATACGVAGRRGGRAKALFGGGGVASGGEVAGGGEASSRSAVTGTRRWSVLDNMSPPLDPRPASTGAALSRPSWTEAAEERVADESSRSPVRQNVNGGVGGNTRRGSMAAGPPGHSFATLFHGSTSSTAPGSMGSSMGMLPPAPRRGSVIAHGPAMPSPPPPQRRGSVAGMGTPAVPPAKEEVSAGWQADFMAPTSQ